MATYLLFGKYSQESIQEISAARTEKAMALIKENGGTYISGYALLGETLVEGGRTDEAIDLYRRAAENEQLPPAARRAFAEKARRLASP